MKALKISAIILLVIVVLEIVARLFWFTTCSGEYDIEKMEPADILRPDSILGYKYVGNNIHIKYYNGFNFNAGLTDGYRLTTNVQSLPDRIIRKQAWIFGDSFHWGWGVTDSCYLFSLLANDYPGIEFKNYSNPGYSATISYLNLLDLVTKDTVPDLVIFQFESYDKERIVLTPLMQKNIFVEEGYPEQEKFLYPYSYIENDSLKISYKKMLVRKKDLRCYSCLANFLDDLTRFVISHFKEKTADETTKKLMSELIDYCKSKNIKLLITARYVSDEDIKFFNSLSDDQTSFFMQYSPHSGDSLSLKPYDNHPSCLGHYYYYKDINTYIATHSLLN